MNVVQYNKATGEITGGMFLPPEVLPEDLESAEVGVIPGYVGYNEEGCFWVQGGEVVERPCRPSRNHNWDGQVWVVDAAKQLADADSKARAERMQLLTASDWTQLPDVPEATRLLWTAYRQALRDITEQAGYPLQIQWPISPA